MNDHQHRAVPIVVPADMPQEEADKVVEVRFRDALIEGKCPHCLELLVPAEGDPEAGSSSDASWRLCEGGDSYWQLDLEESVLRFSLGDWWRAGEPPAWLALPDHPAEQAKESHAS